MTVLAQAEVWDGKNYTIALAAVWSETLHKAAKAALLGKESKAKAGNYTVGEWLSSRDLSLVCGPRQMVDKDGNRVFLGIAAREIGINAARDTVNREAAKSSAESYLVFSLFSDVEQRVAHNAAANFAELDADASEEIDRRMAQNVEKRVISGSREIASYELEHPITHKQMYVSVYSMDQTSIAKARVMAEELIATRVLTELANKYALGKLQGYQDAVDAAKANTTEFNKGRTDARDAIDRKTTPQGRSFTEISAPVAKPPVQRPAQKGLFSGENKIDDDF